MADPAHRASEPRAGEGDGVGEFACGADVAWLSGRALGVLQRLLGGMGEARVQECDSAAPGAAIAARCHAAMAW